MCNNVSRKLDNNTLSETHFERNCSIYAGNLSTNVYEMSAINSRQLAKRCSNSKDLTSHGMFLTVDK